MKKLLHKYLHACAVRSRTAYIKFYAHKARTPREYKYDLKDNWKIYIAEMK